MRRPKPAPREDTPAPAPEAPEGLVRDDGLGDPRAPSVPIRHALQPWCPTIAPGGAAPAGPGRGRGRRSGWPSCGMRGTGGPSFTGVPYLDDSSVHDQMVRFATRRLQAGHLPLTSWFPYLGLGSPHFLHYQSLPSMLTGAAGMVVGGDVAFRWSLYLLLVLWPLPVFVSARVFGLSRAAAAVTRGSVAVPRQCDRGGLRAQGLHLDRVRGMGATVGFVDTSARRGRSRGGRCRPDGRSCPAVVFVALTMALHFETGYLAADRHRHPSFSSGGRGFGIASDAPGSSAPVPSCALPG